MISCSSIALLNYQLLTLSRSDQFQRREAAQEALYIREKELEK